MERLRDKLWEFENIINSTLEMRHLEILSWTDRALEKLHGLSDADIMKYFPNTPADDLRRFRGGEGEVEPG